MKVAAWFLFCRAARMKNRRPLVWRDAGKLQLLECRGGHEGDFRPVPHIARRQTPDFAKSPISGVIFELQAEEPQRRPIKVVILLRNVAPKARGKVDEFCVHCGFYSAGFPPQPSIILTANHPLAIQNQSRGSADAHLIVYRRGNWKQSRERGQIVRFCWKIRKNSAERMETNDFRHQDP